MLIFGALAQSMDQTSPLHPAMPARTRIRSMKRATGPVFQFLVALMVWTLASEASAHENQPIPASLQADVSKVVWQQTTGRVPICHQNARDGSCLTGAIQVLSEPGLGPPSSVGASVLMPANSFWDGIAHAPNPPPPKQQVG